MSASHLTCESSILPTLGLGTSPDLTTIVAGAWPSRRRPWKGRMAVVKAFMFTSLPFVLAEAATGVASVLTGQLSVPPPLGAGTVVDAAILAAGLSVALVRATRTRQSSA